MGKHKEKSHKRKHEDSDSASDESGVQETTLVDFHLTFCRDHVREIGSRTFGAHRSSSDDKVPAVKKQASLTCR